jgi:hypothetical protein
VASPNALIPEKIFDKKYYIVPMKCNYRKQKLGNSHGYGCICDLDKGIVNMIHKLEHHKTQNEHHFFLNFIHELHK